MSMVGSVAFGLPKEMAAWELSAIDSFLPVALVSHHSTLPDPGLHLYVATDCGGRVAAKLLPPSGETWKVTGCAFLGACPSAARTTGWSSTRCPPMSVLTA